jgi:hypothetical protein
MFSGTGMLLAGALSVAFGLIELLRAARLVRVGHTARATVVETKVKEDDGEQLMPTLRFESEDGQIVEFREKTTSARDMQRIGSEVVVLYDPDNPLDARRQAFAQIWGPALFWLVMGAILVVAGLVARVFA